MLRSVLAGLGHQTPFIAICLLAAILPFLGTTPISSAPPGFPGWPTSFQGKPLQALPLTAVEQRFAQHFPGHIGRFSDGRREIILRWVAEATRKLHPAADCFAGSGYAVRPLPMRRDQDGAQWARFRASRGQEAYVVEERIVDQSHGQWTDASAWYWSAILGQSSGPWWAMTVARTEVPETLSAGPQIR